jgi:hypothetical protein
MAGAVEKNHRSTPPPRCFCESVRKAMKTGELNFCGVQKSAQENETREFELVGAAKIEVSCSVEGVYPPAFCKNVKGEYLREDGFVSV